MAGFAAGSTRPRSNPGVEDDIADVKLTILRFGRLAASVVPAFDSAHFFTPQVRLREAQKVSQKPWQK
jgi:hypothetical protein